VQGILRFVRNIANRIGVTHCHGNNLEM